MFLRLHSLLVSLALHVCDCTLSSFLSVHFTTHTHVHKTQSDPILGAAFFQSDVYTQAVLVPVFFLFRAAFEYIADAITSSTFGSDGMPVINYFGVLMHEVCLAMMITSIKHPLVFVSLILSDLAENTFCLWSLSALRLTDGKVSPSAEGKEDEETKQNQFNTDPLYEFAYMFKNGEPWFASNLVEKFTTLAYKKTLLHPDALKGFFVGVRLRLGDFTNVGLFKRAFDTAKNFFERLNTHKNDVDTWVGELYLELHRGTLTTQALVKKQNTSNGLLEFFNGKFYQ